MSVFNNGWYNNPIGLVNEDVITITTEWNTLESQSALLVEQIAGLGLLFQPSLTKKTIALGTEALLYTSAVQQAGYYIITLNALATTAEEEADVLEGAYITFLANGLPIGNDFLSRNTDTPFTNQIVLSGSQIVYIPTATTITMRGFATTATDTGNVEFRGYPFNAGSGTFFSLTLMTNF
jgi:hypothetical protein